MPEKLQEDAIALLKRLGPILAVEEKLLSALDKVQSSDDLRPVMLTPSEIGLLMAMLQTGQQLLLFGGILEAEKKQESESPH